MGNRQLRELESIAQTKPLTSGNANVDISSHYCDDNIFFFLI